MRKIQTVELREAKTRKNRAIIGGVFILLLVLSTAGYSLMSGDDDGVSSKVVENGLTFYRQDGVWKSSIDGQVFAFQYLPSEVANVSVNGSFDLEMYSGQPIYYVGSDAGIVEVLSNIGRYALRYQGACLNERDCEEDLPIKSCENNVFITLEGNETLVDSEENCVYLFGDSVKAADAFLYEVLKI